MHDKTEILEVSDMTNKEAPFTEPEIVPCLYVNGIGIEIADSIVRFVGWVSMLALGGEMDERRICVRFAMSNNQARNLQTVLRKGLARGGH
ncbi:hypothetical protein [uncultured Devosia sp.]|uniref:hypothetical protein n=1 Tax=uncultured Devosia sp. TaxID=211434 RepID=UPI0026284B7B|nr:hypothetical protein [uncultured Devosia sp.]